MYTIKVAFIVLFLCTVPAPGAQEQSRAFGQGAGEFTPTPDPTRLTTAQLIREINSLQKIIETRLEGMDKAINLLQTKADKLPSEFDIKLAAMERLFNEKFRSTESLFQGIQLQFKERDERVVQLSVSTTSNIAAALQAQKEQFVQQNISFDRSTQKAEAAFAKQIEQMAALIQTETRSLDGKISTGTKVSDEKIGTLDRRLTTIESSKLGQGEARAEQNVSAAFIISAFAAFIGLAGFSVALFMAFRQNRVTPGGNGNGG